MQAGGSRFVLPKRNPCRSGQLSCLSKMKVFATSGYYFNFHKPIKKHVLVPSYCISNANICTIDKNRDFNFNV